MAYPDKDNLTQLDTLKVWLRINDTKADVALGTLITRCSNAIMVYVSRPFAADMTLTFNGTGSDRLFIPQYPINTVTTVSVDDLSIPARVKTTDQGFSFDSFSVFLSGYAFTRGLANVVVSLNAGFTTGSYEAKMLEQACLEYCNWLWTKKNVVDVQVQSTGDSVWTKRDMSGLPPNVETILKPIRRVR